VAVLPELWRRKYLQPVGNGRYQIVEKLRKEVIFREFNLNTPVFPFKKKFHVIFCRNVMIYFDSETKRELVDKFYQSLEPGGYLFIGHAESINRDQTKFKYVKPAIYRKE